MPDPLLYRQLVGNLNYLTITRPDISFAVQQVSQFMHSPRHLHMAAVHRIVCYLKGTSHRGLFFPANTSLTLLAYSDADWAGCPDTQKSVSGWCMFLSPALIFWKSKKQAEFPSRPLSLNIELCLQLVLRLFCFVACWLNSVFLKTVPHLYTLITLVPFRLLLIRSFMSVLNILRWIVTPFGGS